MVWDGFSVCPLGSGLVAPVMVRRFAHGASTITFEGRGGFLCSGPFSAHIGTRTAVLANDALTLARS